MAADLGKPIGIVGPNPEMVRRFQDYGYTFTAIASDLAMMTGRARDWLADLRGERPEGRAADRGLLRPVPWRPNFRSPSMCGARSAKGRSGRPRRNALWFTDIVGKRLHRYEPESGAHEAVDCDEEVGCFAFARDGGIVAAMRTAIRLLDRSGKRLRDLAANPDDASRNRFNDGGTDPRGRLWVGTMDETKTKGDGSLFRYDRRGLVRVEGGLMTSNGVAFSPDGRWMYHSDTPRFTIYRYAYDGETGTAGEREVFARLDPGSEDQGRPGRCGGRCGGLLLDGAFRGRPRAALFAERRTARQSIRCPCAARRCRPSAGRTARRFS